jgi:lysophospholipase L1-like esterase
MKTHIETPTTADHTYCIHMGGTLDGVNTRDPVGYSPYKQSYEPNKYVRLENVGDTDLVNPWIIVNNKRDWRSIDHILAGIITDDMTDAEKARAIWEFACNHRYHYTCATDEVKDTVKMLNCYGYTLCWDEAFTVSNLWQAAGLKIRRGYPHGHCTTEVYYNEAYHLLDSDEHLLYLLRDNQTIASEEDLSHDHDLVKRGHPYGITLDENRERSESTASAFFHTGPRSGTRPQLTFHTMNMTLRPNEALLWEWEDRNKYHGYWDRPKRLANGRMQYTPQLSHFETWATQAENLHYNKHGLHPIHANQDAYLDITIQSPYVIVGGKLTLSLTSNTQVSVGISRNDNPYQTLWHADTNTTIKTTIDLNPAFPANSPASYAYRVRIALKANDHPAMIKQITLESDLQMAPLSLPALEVGNNTIHYTADNDGQVEITHAFEEQESDPPPVSPTKPTYPQNGATVSGTQFTFAWPKVEGATDYHFQLSDLPNLQYTLSPVFNKLVSKTPSAKKNQWEIPHEGLLNSNQTYYWRMRPRLANGLWGAWSNIWSFTPQAPHVPIQVEIHPNWEDRTLTLHWQPNPRGNKPDHYEIYGSNERGFTISREPYVVVTGNKKAETFPANLIATTDQTTIQVAGSTIKKGNHAYYRVVAVDKHGVRSGPSAMSEAPRPMIISHPPKQAIVGQPYTYKIQAIASIGDLRCESKGPRRYFSAFRDGDSLRYLLDEGPDFIALDEKTGILTATPKTQDISTHTVTIRVQNGQGDTDMQGFDLIVIPESRFEKDIQAFEKQDQTDPPPKNAVLFWGSSSFRLWHTLKEDLSNLPIINRGFGGAPLRDLIHFMDRIVIPHQPQIVVVYGGSIDLHDLGCSPEQVLDLFKQFKNALHTKLPKTKICYISMKPSISKWNTIHLDQEANRLIAEYAGKTNLVEFVDIWTPMTQGNTPPPKDYFLPDLNHPNHSAYKLWAKIIRPFIAE